MNPHLSLLARAIEPQRALASGQHVTPHDLRESAELAYGICTAHANTLRPLFGAHTIDPDLKRVAILNDIIRAFKRRLASLNAFSTKFSNVPLEGDDNNTVAVPYYPLFTTASTNFDQGTGYSFSENSVTNVREVQISKRKYQAFQFNSSDLRRQPFFNVAQLAALQAEQLAVDVWTDILSAVTAANFGAAVKIAPAAGAFTPEDVVDIEVACEQSDWPEAGRSLVLDSTYRGNVAKGLLKVNEAGTDQALREGSVGRIASFDVFSSPRIPGNSEHLVGFATMPSALLVATSPIMPGPGVRKQLVAYNLVTDPDTGISFEYRYWGNPDKDQDREIIECNYGYDLGEAAALKRITSE